MWISVIKSGFKKNKLKSFPVLAAICIALLVAPTAALAIEFQVPGSETTLNVGGYVKLDIIYNDVAAGDDSQANGEYSPGEVPLNDTTDGEENELLFNARESRMWIKTTTPTDMGPLKTHFEADFDTTEGNQLVSNSRGLRLRHAYGSLDNWLFGQTWSLFMHLNSLPEINDFGGPTGAMFVRQPQLRYTLPMGSSNLQIGFENPETYYESGAFPACDDGQIPDIIVRYNFNPSWGNLSAAAMLRQLKVDEDVLINGVPTAVDDDTMAFAGQVGTFIKLWGKDNFKAQVSFGEGLGRYSSLATFYDVVVNTADLEIKALQQMAGFAGFEHVWGGAMNFRSNFLVGYSKADDPEEVAGSSATEQTMSYHANLLFNPTDTMRLGIEYIRGERETYSGLEGELNRIQFSAMFVF